MSSVLIDTNLLLLLIVGFYNRDLISIHKRTKAFMPKDFDLLVKCINRYNILWVTSHCLAEVSNLIKQTYKKQAKELMAFFSVFIAKVKETHISKDIIFKNGTLPRLGVADTGIIIKSKRVSCVLTIDFDLYREISKKGYKVYNFNHIRMENFI